MIQISKQNAQQALQILMSHHRNILDGFLSKFPTPTKKPEAWKMIRGNVLPAANAYYLYNHFEKSLNK